MNLISYLACIFFGLILAIGCSAGSTPTTPDTCDDPLQVQTPALSVTDKSGSVSTAGLWGYFDLVLDLESGQIEVLPNHNIDFTLNVVKFLDNSPIGLQVAFNGTSSGPDYIDIDLDVTINHPMASSAFDGYDVRGVFIGHGTVASAYNENLKYADSQTEQVLLNADGYTRWFNPTEFANDTIFGYTHGSLATASYTGTATLNPYKYFGEGLDAVGSVWSYLETGSSEVGSFLNNTANTRNYLIRFPVPVPGFKYGYAVIANWGGGTPDFHPSHANEAVAISVVNNSDVYYVDETTNGGSLNLDISVFDWDASPVSGVMEDYSIIVESTVLAAPHVLSQSEMTPIISGVNWYSYQVEILVDNVLTTVMNEFWIVVEDAGADYTNPFGIINDAGSDAIAACFRYDLPILGDPPGTITVTSPNGGEQWGNYGSHEVTWTSENLAATELVNIEYSTDGFNSDINAVAVDELNDGSYMWDTLPCTEINGAQIRVSWADDDNIYDTSDASFAITQNGWAQIVDPLPGGYNDGYNVITDPLGAILVGGSFQGQVDPDTHMFVGKYTPCGSRVWLLTWEDPADIYVGALSTDIMGNIYVGARFTGTDVDLDPTPGTDIRSSAGDVDCVIIKLTPEGNYLWAATWGTPGFEILTCIAVDQAGNIYGTGQFFGTMDFDPSDAVVFDLTAGGYDSFLTSLDTNGVFRWAVNWGSIDGTDAGTGICVDDNYNLVYVSGYFNGTDADFDPGTDPGEEDMHTSEYNDAYLTCYSPSGTYQWAITWGGSGDEFGETVGVDLMGNTYIGGYYNEITDFDPGPPVDNHTPVGGGDCYISTFNESGNYRWAITWGGVSWDTVNSISIDISGNIAAVGIFNETVDFDPSPDSSFELTSVGQIDPFLAVYNSTGEFLWARSWGSPNYDVGTEVAFGPMGEVYTTGWFSGTDIEFAETGAPCNDESTLLGTGVGGHAFLTKHLPDGCW